MCFYDEPLIILITLAILPLTLCSSSFSHFALTLSRPLSGVFGFINSHRVHLVLSYTHDLLPDGRHRARVDTSCRDTPGAIANAQDGRPLTCADVAPHCASHAQLQELCPLTCDRCPGGPRGAWVPSAVDKVAWAPLEFKNLPGEPSRRPYFNSPYHYRLDWETWIHVTASMEHVMTNRPPSAASQPLDLSVPRHIQTLVQKVLSGDTDAMHLLGTPPEALLRLTTNTSGAQSPTAIRADFYSYTFTSWEALWRHGRWWDRQRLSNPVVFERGSPLPRPSAASVAAAGNRLGVRRSPWQRFWLLMGAAMGIFLSMRSLLTSQTSIGLSRGLGSEAGGAVPTPTAMTSAARATSSACVRILNPLAALAAYWLVAALAFTSDYPRSGAAAQLVATTTLSGFAGIAQLLPPAFVAMSLAQLAALAALVACGSKGRDGRGGGTARTHTNGGRGDALILVVAAIQYVGLPFALVALAQDATVLQAKLSVIVR